MHSVRLARRLIVAAAVGVLGACATEPPSAAVAPAAEALFAVDGRMSVVVVQNDGLPRSSTGQFSWIEHAGYSEIALYSPLGDTLAQIDVRNGLATMRTPDGRLEYAPTPEALMARVVGAALPVTGLRDWLRGRSRGGEMRAPAAFDEDGWHVSYPRMSDDGRSPKIVRLERSRPDAVDVRIVIDNWKSGVASGGGDPA